MMQEKVVLSVVIATYNGAEYIGRCLESFTHQSINNKLFEVIIVDNNSLDHTADVVSEFIRIRDNFLVVTESIQGVSHARNKGISISRGKYICFIDDDAYADYHWLEEIYHAFETLEPRPAVVGGRVFPYYQEERPTWFKDSFEIRTKGSQSRFLSKQKCVFGFPESNYSVRKEILNEVGSFSVDYGPKGDKMIFGEGAELSSRIASKYPYFWYNPEIFVYHLVPKRNMSVKYVLTRKYRSSYNYQLFESRTMGMSKTAFTFCQCFLRIWINLLLSVFFVRWFTNRMISDWLTHMNSLVSCSARCYCILRQMLGYSS